MATYTYTTSCTHHIELDLSAACPLGPNSIQDRINDVVPGLKTSTAFFHFLRANLALQPSAMSSNVSTPLLEPQGLPLGTSPLSRHVTSARPSTPQAQPSNLDDIPPLSLDVLTSRNDKVDALKLIADSIAQQRQCAAYGLIFHPLLLAGLVLVFALTYQLVWLPQPAHNRGLGLAMTLLAGTLMAYLAAIRYATAGYIQLAEDIKYDFLVSSNDTAAGGGGGAGDEDIVIGTRYGSELIGALVLRLEPGSASSSPPRRRNHHRAQSLFLRGGKGVIRAWTVRLRYRGKELGADLLHEAVRITRERCGKDAEVGFAAEHANSQMVLPEMFNRTFRQGERRAAGALEKVLSEWEGARRKR